LFGAKPGFSECFGHKSEFIWGEEERARFARCAPEIVRSFAVDLDQLGLTAFD
jgi:hypothetical protein